MKHLQQIKRWKSPRISWIFNMEKFVGKIRYSRCHRQFNHRIGKNWCKGRQRQHINRKFASPLSNYRKTMKSTRIIELAQIGLLINSFLLSSPRDLRNGVNKIYIDLNKLYQSTLSHQQKNEAGKIEIFQHKDQCFYCVEKCQYFLILTQKWYFFEDHQATF